MRTYVDFGGTPEFKLTGAILIYQGERKSFCTYHAVRQHSSEEPPQLDVAQPLSTGFLKALAGELGYRVAAEILPEGVLARTPEMLVWWTPARRRTMFFADHAKELREVNGKQFPQPPLVFKVVEKDLWVRALSENKRPGPATVLKVAPFWNCSAVGHCCQGSMRSPEVGTSLDAIDVWDRAFFQSEFTHAYGVARLTTFPGGFTALWNSLADAREPFPAKYLADAGETLQQFVEGRDSR